MTRPRLLALAAAALTLAGCASNTTVDAGAGAALPDQTYVATAQAREFDADYKQMDAAMTDGHAVRGTMFKHASFGAKKSNEEWDVEFLGRPTTIFTRTRVEAGEGGNLDMLHPPAGGYDYFLLGRRFASIAKTPWARVPTNYHDPLNVCLVTGYQQICDIQDAVTYTAQEQVPVTKRVSRDPDGTRTLTTGVTLQALLKNPYLLNVPSSIRSQFTARMLSYQIPARFVIDAGGAVQMASVSGTIPGATPFQVQIGFQTTGSAALTDLPALPAAKDVTTVAYSTFYAEVARINGIGK